MQALAEQYCQAETLYLREREADIRDLTRQVLNQLCGVSEQHFITTAPCILLANDLLPSQITSLNKAHILGICLHNGGTTSHTAILARAMGIPAIVKAAITRKTSAITTRSFLMVKQAVCGYSRMRSPAWIYCNAPKHGGNKGIVS
ncbi:hypothetical protein BCH06_24690 [Escherichia coli]|nr:hypothetical protein BCH06_24690 [Escherichia coli]